MEESELFKYYSLSECSDPDLILKKLDKLKKDDKIIYSFDTYEETVIIKDLELTDSDITKLVKLFEKNDVLPNYDYTDDHFKDDDYSDFEDDDYDF